MKKDLSVGKVLIAPFVVIILYAVYIFCMIDSEFVVSDVQRIVLDAKRELGNLEGFEREVRAKQLVSDVESVPKNKFVAGFADYGRIVVDALSPLRTHCVSGEPDCVYYSGAVLKLRSDFPDLPAVGVVAGWKDVVGTGFVLFLEFFALSIIVERVWRELHSRAVRKGRKDD